MKKMLSALLLIAVLISSLALSAGAEITVSPENPMELTFTWWGGDARHALFNKILDMYEDKYPGLTITRIYSDYNSYWTKMATMVASGDAPECFGMVMMQKPEYAKLGVMENLDPYIESGALDVSSYTEGALNAGRVDGSLYMLTWGDTCFCTVANKTLIESVGMEMPNNDMTLDDYYDYCVELQSRLPEGYYATGLFNSSNEFWFEDMVAQLGYEFITEDGADLGFPKEILKDWYAYFMKISDAKLGPTANEWADNDGKGYADKLEGTGRIALYQTNLNQAKIMQAAVEDELKVFRVAYHPQAVVKYTDLIQPSAMCINKNATPEQKEVAIAIYNDFVNSPEMQDIFAMEWGVPGSTKIQEHLLAGLDESTPQGAIRAEEIKLYSLISSTTAPSEGRRAGTAAMLTEISKTYYEILFGRMTIDQAVDAVFDSAWTILS